MRCAWIVVLTACSATVETPDAAAEFPTTGFFVAPGGSDSADGSIDAPFATIERAVIAMRDSSEKTTHVRAGFYEQRGKPIVLDERDSGVTIVAYPGERPVVSGGFRMAPWTEVRPGVWSADVPSDLRIGAVTVDGAWLDEARTPNRVPGDPRAGWFFVEQSLGPPVENPWDPSFAKDDAFVYRGGDLAGAEPGAWISVWDKFGWSHDVLQIASIDHGSRTVRMHAASQFGLAPNSRYFVYGAPAALDAPGEFVRDGDKLLIAGEPGDIVVASAYNGPPVISIEGANDVRISGLEIRDQHNTGRWGVEPGGAVRVAAGDNARIVDNMMRSVGVGVHVDGGTGHVIAGNAIYDTACTAVVMFGDGNTITGNDIHDVGLLEQASHGIVVGPGRNVIAHNRIADVPHYAIIAVGDKADGLVIEYNRIERANLGANDAGAIYLKNRGNYNPAAREAVRYNTIIGSGGLAVDNDGNMTAPGFSFAVYLDEGQSGTDVYGNVIVGASYGAVFPHNGTDNRIFNNIFVGGVHAQLFLESSNAPANNVWERNVFVSSSPTPTVYVKYAGQEETFRDNLFWNPAATSFIAYGNGGALSLDAAEMAGFVTGSVVADPLLQDDYRLRPESPAFALGFQELPYAEMGL